MRHPIRPFFLRTTCFVALLGLGATGASASYRVVRPIGYDARAAVEQACTAPASPASPACEAAREDLARQAAITLATGARHLGSGLSEIAGLAADSGYPALRAAAATALASPFATAAETPLLAELADDPVPAVRIAALRALRSSNDPRAQRIARRADAFGDRPTTGEAAEQPEAAPAAARMGVPLPAGAVYLHFASDPAAGRYAWHTVEPAERVLTALRGKGKGPLSPDEFRAQAQPKPGGGASGMPSADEMQRAMAMAEQMMKAMEGAQGKSPQEQAAAMERASHGVSSLDSDLAGAYEKEELFVDPRLVIVPLAEGGEVVVAVYADPVVGGTGVTLHRAPLEVP